MNARFPMETFLSAWRSLTTRRLCSSPTAEGSANNPVYWKAEARTNPLTIGPSVCPTSIMVLRKPIDEPTNPAGASSLMSGEVEEITMAKPKPYPTAISRSSEKSVVKGTANKSSAPITEPKTMGKRRPFLSDSLPSAGLAIIIVATSTVKISPA